MQTSLKKASTSFEVLYVNPVIIIWYDNTLYSFFLLNPCEFVIKICLSSIFGSTYLIIFLRIQSYAMGLGTNGKGMLRNYFL